MSDDPNFSLGGGPPPFSPGPSLEDDEKALKKGNTMVMVLGLGAALLVTVVLGVILLSGDDTEPYEAIGRQVNGMKQEHFDGFWSCALPGGRLDELRNDQDVRYALNKRAVRGPSAYAQLVREQCLVKLNEHEQPLRQLLPPEDLAQEVAALTTALNDLRGGWNEYLDALSRAEGGYDEEAMAPQLNKIAKGWYDYKHAHGEINTVIRGHLDQ